MAEEYINHLYALIVCGGAGTRLWPYSRASKPKQFLAIKGKKSLLRKTFERLTPLLPPDRIYAIITTNEYLDDVQHDLPELKKQQIIIEPLKRNTAMAVGLGSLVIRKRDPEAIVASIWADHLIEDKKAYQDALLTAAKTATGGQYLVTVGVVPQFAHTGLGYIKKGQQIIQSSPAKVFKLDKFTEKPDIQKAKEMLVSGDYLWHTAPLVWRVDTFFNGLKQHSPDTYHRLMEFGQIWGKLFGAGKIRRIYESAPDVSIDYALSEKADNFAVIEGKFDWVDIGDLSVLWGVEDKNSEGNATILKNGGEWLGLETKNSLVINESPRMVATLGLNNLIIVVTDKAILVADKTQSQKVKQVVEALKNDKKIQYL